MNFKTPPIGKKAIADNSVIDNNLQENQDETEDTEAEIMDGESEEVPLDNKINDDQKTTTIDFQNQDDIDNILKAKTKDSEFEQTSKEENKYKNLDAEDIREEIKNEESKASEKYTYQDFANIAAFLLTLYDTGLSTGLSAWAKDTPSAYEMPKDKKRILEHQLTLILIKYQAKFSLEFMFLATLLLVSSTPILKARKRKKDIKEYELKQKSRPTAKEKETAPITENKDMGAAEQIADANPWKKKQGRPPKNKY